MLPLSAMAATEYSFQLIPGDDMASVDAIKDLFDVLTVRFLKGEGSGMLTLSLSGERRCQRRHAHDRRRPVSGQRHSGRQTRLCLR
ncbi:MAG: hypothetical protein ACLUE8_17820 [Lachnospiraceae bacterium]